MAADLVDACEEVDAQPRGRGRGGDRRAVLLRRRPPRHPGRRRCRPARRDRPLRTSPSSTGPSSGSASWSRRRWPPSGAGPWGPASTWPSPPTCGSWPTTPASWPASSASASTPAAASSSCRAGRPGGRRPPPSASSATRSAAARAADLGIAWEALPDGDVEARAKELAARAGADPELARRNARSFRNELGPPMVTWPRGPRRRAGRPDVVAPTAPAATDRAPARYAGSVQPFVPPPPPAGSVRG